MSEGCTNNGQSEAQREAVCMLPGAPVFARKTAPGCVARGLLLLALILLSGGSRVELPARVC